VEEEEKIKIKAEFAILMEHVDERLELHRCATKLFKHGIIDKNTMKLIESQMEKRDQRYRIIVTKPFREVPEDWQWAQRFLMDHMYEKKMQFMEKLLYENLST
jgi:hypothetical protein